MNMITFVHDYKPSPRQLFDQFSGRPGVQIYSRANQMLRIVVTTDPIIIGFIAVPTC